jgi:hypothetical protein
VWGACQGAGLPRPGDGCFDGVDEDCNGVVDDRCLDGDGSVDLCAGLDPSQVHAFLVPTTHALSAPTISLFVLATESISPAGTNIIGPTGAGHCAGGAGLTDLAPGPTCAGWYAIRQALDATDSAFAAGPGAYTFEVFLRQLPGAPPCTQAAKKVPFSFTLSK